MAYAVEANHLFVSVRRRLILRDVTCRIKKGDMVSVIGPNGSGKSTLLRALSRMIVPDKGSIKVFGRPIRSFSRKKLAQHIAVLPQMHQAPDDLTVSELVSMGRFPYRRFYTASSPEDALFVEQAIRAVHLEPYRDIPVKMLSGGEQQQAWLAMLLAQRSPVLFLDEPTTYLDMSHQLHMMKLLQHINKKLGLTIVIVLHDMNQALRYTHRTVVMKDGAVIRAGDAGEVITPACMKNVFGVEMEMIRTAQGRKILVPIDVDCRENMYE